MYIIIITTTTIIIGIGICFRITYTENRLLCSPTAVLLKDNGNWKHETLSVFYFVNKTTLVADIKLTKENTE
jgi:hypothetical protein